MNYVDLSRCFVVIGKEEEANLDIGRTWGRKIAGWLDWQELLECRRVVLLAEASSGKTEEFRFQASQLVTQGKAAFFVRIEDLADEGFEAALERSAVADFEHWRDGEDSEIGFSLSQGSFLVVGRREKTKLTRKSVEQPKGEPDRSYAAAIHR